MKARRMKASGMKAWTLIAGLGCAIVLAATGPAMAEEMTWQVRNSYDYRIRIAFYSLRYDRAWPGNGQGFALNDSRRHSFTLSCQRGERICYGAWPDGDDSAPHWGVGQNRRHRCTTCCGICGKDHPVKELRGD